MVMLPDMPPQMPGFLWAGFEPRGLRVIAIGFLVAAFFASCSASLPSTNQSAASPAAPGRQRCHCSGAVQGAATPSRAPFACERPLRSTLTPPAAPLGVVSASGAAALLRRAPAGCWPLHRLGCRIRAAWPRSALLLCAAAVGLATRLCRQARKLCAQPPGPTTPALLQAPHKQTTPAPPALGGASALTPLGAGSSLPASPPPCARVVCSAQAELWMDTGWQCAGLALINCARLAPGRARSTLTRPPQKRTLLRRQPLLRPVTALWRGAF